MIQVIDLGEEAPEKVLHRLFCNFETLKSKGDTLAAEIERRLRIIVSYYNKKLYLEDASCSCLILFPSSMSVDLNNIHNICRRFRISFAYLFYFFTIFFFFFSYYFL